MAERKARGGSAKKGGDFADLLRQGKETYEAGEQYDDMSFEKVPAGTGYMVRLGLLEWRKAASSGNLMLHREHVVIEGEHAGRTIFDNMMFGLSDFGDGKIRNYLKTVTGEDLPEDPADLEELVQKVNDEMPYDAKVNLKYDNDFANLTVVECYDIDDSIDLDDLKKGSGKEEKEEKEEKKTSKKDSGKTSKSKKEEPEEDPLDQKIRDFIEDQSLSAEMKKKKRDLNSIDDMKDEIADWDYEEGDLSEENLEVLEELDLTDCIKKPEPPAKATRSKR